MGETPKTSFEIDEHNVCCIRLREELSQGHVAAVVRRAQAYIAEINPRGLLLDVREAPDLSIVRLTELVDALAGLGLRVAVLFGHTRQQQIARLLRNTLIHKDLAGYFTDGQEARSFVITGDPPREDSGGF
jgi:anti-anti-sigma regulatory factor